MSLCYCFGILMNAKSVPEILAILLAEGNEVGKSYGSFENSVLCLIMS